MPTMDTVLVVDDHAGFRELATQLVTSYGCLVVGEAQDGSSAITEAERLRPDLVLLDVQLPDLDGFEVARRILERPEPPRILLISTREAADYGARVATSGAAGFVTKSRLTAAVIRSVLG
jgi:CheY-like chemotaxis protein